MSITTLKSLYLPESSAALLSGFTQQLRTLGYRDNTSYTSAVREWLHWCWTNGLEQAEVNTATMKTYYAYLSTRPNKTRTGGLSSSTLQGYVFGLRLFFSWRLRSGQLSSDPMSGLRFAAAPKAVRTALSQAAIRQLYAACATVRQRAVLGLFYGCGLRRNEAVQLEVTDLRVEQKLLLVRKGKGNVSRSVPVSEGVLQDFLAWLPTRSTYFTPRCTVDDHRAFMLNLWGRRMRGGSYWKLLKVLLKRTDLPPTTSLHHLRHSIATHLLQRGMAVERVRDFLGHAHLETTQIYTHL